MALKREQIGKDRRWVSLPGKWIKNQTSRWRRRKEKKEGEDTPPKATKGWAG
ncbi:MAG TPA: hypothetical protein VD948_02405 [Rhodothermales bacterium]|nr:hypothetical protein [Rhodothermales bacterium]